MDNSNTRTLSFWQGFNVGMFTMLVTVVGIILVNKLIGRY